MKILDPQSAALLNAEVWHFLATHPPRAPDPVRIGSYPTPDLRGYHSVRKELADYVERVAPCIQVCEAADWGSEGGEGEQREGVGEIAARTTATATSTAGGRRDGWVERVVKGLSRWELTKAEVLMIVNLGLGLDMRESKAGPSHSVEASARMAVDEAEKGEEQAEGRMDEDDAEHQNRGKQPEPEAEAETEQEQNHALVLHAVVEELEQRFTEEDIEAILQTVRTCVQQSRPNR